jgi:Ca2+:H+ antiporter
MKHKQQKFNRTAAAMSATMMALSAVALLIPAVFHFVTADQMRLDKNGQLRVEHELSLEIAVVLFAVYVLSLVFSLRTHKDLYVGENPSHGGTGQMKASVAVGILVAATLLVAWMSELLVRAVEPASRMLGLTDIFVGVIVVAVIGNAAEHSTAVITALKNQMDLSYHIAVGSSTQIALFVAPVLVFASYAMGNPMDLLFTTFEVITVGLGVGVVTLVALDGESNWMEGVLLLAVYLIFALAFFFLPPGPRAA